MGHAADLRNEGGMMLSIAQTQLQLNSNYFDVLLAHKTAFADVLATPIIRLSKYGGVRVGINLWIQILQAIPVGILLSVPILTDLFFTEILVLHSTATLVDSISLCLTAYTDQIS